ncbi:MAG: diaminopimelate epimerase [Candidatus Altiarchaeota archaeon]
MHGIGNDYIVIDNRNGILGEPELSPTAKKICLRHFSVGADGLLLVQNADSADIRMRMFNPDGSEAEMCGNGIRCFSKYVFENDILSKKEFSIDTMDGIKKISLETERDVVKKVLVDMGTPKVHELNQNFSVEKKEFKLNSISMGNPHAVFFVEKITDELVLGLGPKIEVHERFQPKKTNVEFVKVKNSTEIEVRVWERGVGETLACGTGACAAVVAGISNGILDSQVEVHLLGGTLKIKYEKEKVSMEGPAETSFTGQIII